VECVLLGNLEVELQGEKLGPASQLQPGPSRREVPDEAVEGAIFVNTDAAGKD